MTRRALACQMAEAYAPDNFLVSVVALSDGVVALIRGREDVAFKVLAECQEESEESAIGWSSDRRVWCVVCPKPSAFGAVQCRVAEELHLFDGLTSPLARDAGITIADKAADATLAAFAARESNDPA